MTAQTLTEMRRLLRKHGLQPRRHLGQHFLADPNLIRRIVAAAGVTGEDHVLEVGAGTGTLTRELARSGAKVLALEVDRRLEGVLTETLAGMAVDLRFGDALRFDYSELQGVSWKLVANLPYEVGTVLILDLLRRVPAITEFTVMVQEEVGRRLVAQPDSPDYGLPSVIVGLHGQARLLFTVPPQVFYPPPRVESAVVRIVRNPADPATERAIELATAGFAQRRKMLRSSLRAVLPEPSPVLLGAGIDPTRRPESLAPDEFLTLAKASG